MCVQPRYIAQCDCSVFGNINLCHEAIANGDRACDTPARVGRKTRISEYCPDHERLRRHHDAQDILIGKDTIHGLTVQSWYAQVLRDSGFLKDPDYFMQHPELTNPYAGAETVESLQETLESLREPAIRGGELEETWAEFVARKGGIILLLEPVVQDEDSMSSAVGNDANSDEDWTKIEDPVQRKRVQSRVHMRKKRQKAKEAFRRNQMLKICTSKTNAPPKDQDMERTDSTQSGQVGHITPATQPQSAATGPTYSTEPRPDLQASPLTEFLDQSLQALQQQHLSLEPPYLPSQIPVPVPQHHLLVQTHSATPGQLLDPNYSFSDGSTDQAGITFSQGCTDSGTAAQILVHPFAFGIQTQAPNQYPVAYGSTGTQYPLWYPAIQNSLAQQPPPQQPPPQYRYRPNQNLLGQAPTLTSTSEAAISQGPTIHSSSIQIPAQYEAPDLWQNYQTPIPQAPESQLPTIQASITQVPTTQNSETQPLTTQQEVPELRKTS